MRKLFLSLFCFFVLAWVSSSGAWNAALMSSGSGTSATGTTCTVYESQTVHSNHTHIGELSDAWYVGEVYVAPANIDVCKLVFLLDLSAGSPETQGYSYVAEIYTLSGQSLDISQGTSSPVAADDDWSDTEVQFDFSSSVPLTATVKYGVIVRRSEGSADASNYISTSYTETDESPLDAAAEDFKIWKDDKTRYAAFNGWDIYLRVYTEQ